MSRDHVFISYAAQDEPTARLVEEALNRHGVKTWSARNLSVGSNWSEEILSALRNAAAAVVLVTPSSLQSKWVTREWSTAISESKRVIPALAGGASFSDLPAPLLARHGVDLNADLDEGVGQIAAAVGPLQGSDEPLPLAQVDIEGLVEEMIERKLSALGVDRVPAQSEPESEDPKSVFVVASFAPDMEPAYEAVRAAAEAVGLHAFRVKDVAGDYRITDRILSSIRRARFVVADLTHERPNVYFELGYARGLGKTVVTILRTGTKAHFDIRDWTYLEYSDSRPLERDLIERFKYELESGPGPATS